MKARQPTGRVRRSDWRQMDLFAESHFRVPEPGNTVTAWRRAEPRRARDRGTILLEEVDNDWALYTPVLLELPAGWCVDRDKGVLRDHLGMDYMPKVCVEAGWVRVIG